MWSACESMVTHVFLHGGGGLLLSAEVSVEHGILASKEVWGIFAIVCVQVSCQTWEHVITITAWSQTWVQTGSRIGVQQWKETPSWENNKQSVNTEQSQTLSWLFNPDWVQVHVEFWGKLIIQHCLNVLQMVTTSEFVQFVWLWVRFSKSTPRGLQERWLHWETRAGSHHETEWLHFLRINYFYQAIIKQLYNLLKLNQTRMKPLILILHSFN